MTDTWSDNFTYTFVADGATLAAGTDGVYTTSFSQPGTYPISVYATPTNGSAEAATAFATLSINVMPVMPLTPAEVLSPDGARLVIAYDAGTTDDWNITKVTYDFGDGTPVVTSSTGQAQHTYAKGGRYNVTETVTDAGGNTASITKPISTEAPAAGTLTDTYLENDGLWVSAANEAPPSGSGIEQAAETGMRNGTLQAVAVTSAGTLEFATRTAKVSGTNGVWSPWTVLSQPGVTVTGASIAGMANGSSQIIEVTSTGVLKHDVRDADGTWQVYGWSSPAGSTGITQASITVLPAGISETVALTTSDTVEVDRRSTTWSGWITPDIEEANGSETFASDAAMPDNSTDILLVNGG